MFDKKTLPLIVVLVLAILFWFPLLEWLGIYKPVPPASRQEAAQSTEQTAADSNAVPLGQSPMLPDTNIVAVPTDSVMGFIQSDTLPADTVVIQTNKYTVVMSNDGGGPMSILLKEFHYKDTADIEMLPEAEQATPDALFAGQTFSSSTLRYSGSKPAGEYDAVSSDFEIEYRYDHPRGGTIIKRYLFYPDAYHFDLVLEIRQPSSMGLERSYQMIWNTPLGVTEEQVNIDYEAMEAVAMMSGSRERLDDFVDGRLNQSLTGYTEWAGVRSKYFAAVLIPRERQGDAAVARGYKREITNSEGKAIEQRSIVGGLEMPFANIASVHDSFTVFVGPLDYSLMADYDVGLEDMLDIGTTPFVGWMIKPFAIAIIWLLPRMYDLTPNFGIVIILFALLVKIITLPLSMKSFKSMNAMKELQPKMEELKTKYKKDPQAMQRETMKLYREHGVNPISGCLPMLPQMPLFFAMFSVFRSTILLRHAPFVWYIDDLSRGASGFTDPYIALVVIMILAQFISQKLTMASTQQNKALLMLMPLFMGFLFYQLSAGLILYWTCFSAFSLLDYAVFKRNKSMEPSAVVIPDAPESAKKSSKSKSK